MGCDLLHCHQTDLERRPRDWAALFITDGLCQSKDTAYIHRPCHLGDEDVNHFLSRTRMFVKAIKTELDIADKYCLQHAKFWLCQAAWKAMQTIYATVCWFIRLLIHVGGVEHHFHSGHRDKILALHVTNHEHLINWRFSLAFELKREIVEQSQKDWLSVARTYNWSEWLRQKNRKPTRYTECCLMH